MNKLVSRLQAWLRSTLHRPHLESEMEEEIRFHLEARAADLAREGLDPREAMRQARIEFGAVAAHKDGMRTALGLRWWDELWADLRYAARILRKSPGFTAIAIGSLALAIGANTTIFSVANELLFERLAVPHPEELRLLQEGGDDHMAIQEAWGSYNARDGALSVIDVFTYPVYEQLKKHNTALQDIFAFKNLGKVNVTANGVARGEQLQLVSGNYYQQLQVNPQLGRPILPADDMVPGAGAVAVISDAYWTREFGRSSGVIGKSIRVNLNLVTIVGVNPPGFTGADSVQSSPDLFMPLSMVPLLKGAFGDSPLLMDTSMAWVKLMARAKPDVSPQQAQLSLDSALNAAVQGTMKLDKDQTVPHIVIDDGSRGSNGLGNLYARPMYVLIGMVGCLLLLACANMANLMLARASVRQREMGVRLALGASRLRILRQVLTESLLISSVGGAAGLLLGYFARNGLPSLTSFGWESVDIQIPFNWKVFAFTAGLTISTGIIFGVAPAWAATKTAIGTSLKQGSRTASRRRSTWSGKLIVAFQITVSTLLVIAAGLFLRSLVHLDSINPGFRTDHLVLFAITPPDQKNAPLKGAALHASLTDAFRNVPGVQGVTLADVPLVAGFMSNEAFHIEGEEGKAPVGDGMDHDPDFDLVGTDFFSVMGIRLLAGRTFNAQDTATSPRVALINQAMAHKYFPNENPIGKRFSPNEAGTPDRKWTQIIGICADTRFASLRADPPPMHFDLYLQQDDVGGMTYIVRTRMKSEAIVPSLRAAVQRVDANLPMLDIRTQQEQIDATTQQERMFASLTAGFGVLALTLACVGIYGIMAYTVSQRTNEIGIRLALGAERGQVRGLVLREAAWLAIFGVVAGVAVALALGRLVKSMLYGLQPTDPPSLAAAASLLLAVALLASWMPALRASRVEPMVALRHE